MERLGAACTGAGDRPVRAIPTSGVSAEVDGVRTIGVMAAHVSPSDLLDRALTPGDSLERLRALTALQAFLSTLTDDAVAAARSEGASWTAIGEALGVSRQGARQKFAPERQPASAGQTPGPAHISSPRAAGTPRTPPKTGWNVRLPGGLCVLTVEPRPGT